MSLMRQRLGVLLGALALSVAGAAIYWSASQRDATMADGAAAARPGEHSMATATDSAAVVPASDVQVSAVARQLEESPSVREPGSVLGGEGPFANRLAEASAFYGVHDYRVRRAVIYARRLCESRDPSGSLALPMPDPSRDWVFEKIAELCKGMDSLQIDESVPHVGEPESLLRIDRAQGRDAAMAAAEELLANESDPVLVYEAALFAWEAGRAPSPASMGVNPEAVGPAEQMAAVSAAAMLASCHPFGSCGPTDWRTLEFCAQFGCAPGSRLDQALRSHHGEQRMRLIDGYVRWIRSFRAG